jgi:hypothetical protein
VNQATHPFEQLTVAAFRGRLDRGFRGGLGDILGDAGDPLRRDDPRDGKRRAPTGVERRKQHEAADLQDQTHREHARDAETRRQPAAAEIGKNSGRLVEQEQ